MQKKRRKYRGNRSRTDNKRGVEQSSGEWDNETKANKKGNERTNIGKRRSIAAEAVYALNKREREFEKECNGVQKNREERRHGRRISGTKL
jgi:hypothetical protein